MEYLNTGMEYWNGILEWNTGMVTGMTSSISVPLIYLYFLIIFRHKRIKINYPFYKHVFETQLKALRYFVCQKFRTHLTTIRCDDIMMHHDVIMMLKSDKWHFTTTYTIFT